VDGNPARHWTAPAAGALLAFTAVAEYAGPHWAGRALGIQNTGQNLMAAATPPVAAALIAADGYPAAFAVAAVLPLAAAALVPVAALGGYGATGAGMSPVPAGAGSAPSVPRARSSHHCCPAAGRVWIGS
jgi:hypothetical protein